MKTNIFRWALLCLSILVSTMGFSSCDDTIEHEPEHDSFILSYSLSGYEGVIDDEAGTIAVSVPMSFDLSTATASMYISTNATVSPTASEKVDFTQPVKYVVTGRTGIQKEYSLVILNLENQIKSLSVMINGSKYESAIDHVNGLITLYVPSTITDLSNLTTNIEIFEGATIDPGLNVVVDLSKEKEAIFIVDYEGAKKIYRLKAEVAKPTTIKSFKIGDVAGIVDNVNRTIEITLAPGSDVKALVPTIVCTDESAIVTSPTNVENGVDFSSGAVTFTIYTVMGGPIDYTVRINYDMIIYSAEVVSGDEFFSGDVDNAARTISMNLPFTVADVTSLKLNLKAVSGVSITTSVGSIDNPLDLTNPITVTLSLSGYPDVNYTLKAVKQTPKVAFLSLSDSPANIINEDEAAAYLWFKNNVANGEFLSFNDVVAGKSLDYYKVIWWHNDARITLPNVTKQAAPAIKAYYEKGGHLFLSTFATQYLVDLGVQKDGKGPNLVGQQAAPVSYPWGLGLNITGHDNHAVFSGLFILNFGDGNRVYLTKENVFLLEKSSKWIFSGDYGGLADWKAKTGGLDLGGREYDQTHADGVDMAEFPQNMKGKGEGAVICIGNEGYDWVVVPGPNNGNDFQGNIEGLTKNSINYLMNK